MSKVRLGAASINVSISDADGFRVTHGSTGETLLHKAPDDCDGEEEQLFHLLEEELDRRLDRAGGTRGGREMTAILEMFEVRNRCTGEVQFTAEIETTPDMLPSFKLRLAMEWARKNGAVLRDAVLRGADLRHADLSGAGLSGADLRGADLNDADLSGAVLRGADLRGADLIDADMSYAVLIGADLSGAVLRGADLSYAGLSYAVLRGADLRGAVLRGADLRHADLIGADLIGADLSGAVLRGAVLNGADWIPKIENIHQRIYEAASAEGALDMSSWHRGGHCGTTHHRAGWAVVLAGPEGRVMEGVYGTEVAAALIYQASDPTLERIPNWIDTNEGALADMKQLAEQTA